MVKVRVLVCTSGLSVLLQVLLRMLQMVRASRVSPSYRAFLEVTLQDVASAECILTQMTLVGSFARV